MSEQPPTDTVTLRLSITGRVQGVGYRAWAQQAARRLGLDGWVRNRADRSVEAVVQGPAVAVAQFVAACHDGPPAARVRGVAQAPAATLVEAGFHQRPTL